MTGPDVRLTDAWLGLIAAALVAALLPWWVALPAVFLAGGLVYRAARTRPPTGGPHR